MREERLASAEEERLQAFSKLRAEVNEQIELATAERIKSNPHPSEEEILAGGFREMIEPQVRDAVFEFRRKGYATQSSGFYGENGESQSIDGYFTLDESIKQQIEALGVVIKNGNEVGLPGLGDQYTFIQFKPTNPSLDEIKCRWDQIAEFLPDPGKPVEPAVSGRADDFRKKFAPERVDIEMTVLKIRLALDPDMPDEFRKPIEKRIAKIEQTNQ
ncbi:MAG: hypothetical protein ABIB97_00575 [Patescibacteria group bacterium]